MNEDASLEDVMSSEFAINLISYASAIIIMMGIGLVIMWILFYILDVHAGRRSIGFPRTKVVKEPITKTDQGYYVNTPDNERVFVSYAELYPNDPNAAARSRATEKGKFVWSSNNRKFYSKNESYSDNNGLMSGLIIGSAISNSSDHTDYSSRHDHDTGHCSTDHSGNDFGGDCGGDSGGGGSDF